MKQIPGCQYLMLSAQSKKMLHYHVHHLYCVRITHILIYGSNQTLKHNYRRLNLKLLPDFNDFINDIKMSFLHFIKRSLLSLGHKIPLLMQLCHLRKLTQIRDGPI